MARSDTLRSDLARLVSKEATLQKDLARHRDAAAKARETGSRKRREAERTKSDSTRKMHDRSATEQDKKLAAAEKEIGRITGLVGDNDKAKAAKQRSLHDAVASEQRTADQQDRRRRREELSHVRAVSRAQAPTVAYVEVPAPEPEKLRVVYLTANPEAVDTTTVDGNGVATTEHHYLRLDREVRDVRQALRGAKYRDLVTVEHHPAATGQDLIEAMNDDRPHVVHFSGHGWTGGVVFDDGDLHEAQNHPVEFDVLAMVLAATSTPPRVFVLNACDTLAGAEQLLPAVPVVIAMSDEIADTDAIVFARSFYAAIASAQPVGAALSQARAVLRMTNSTAADLPQVAVREGVDIDRLVLVRPPGAGAIRDQDMVLLQDHGLGALAVRVLRHVQSLEADGGGALATRTAAGALGVEEAAVRTEVQRLMDGGYLAADDVETDLTGALDLSAPRLTDQGVAALVG